jgi:hypothetical protein
MLIVKTFNILHIFFYGSSKNFNFGEIFFRKRGRPACNERPLVRVLIRVDSCNFGVKSFFFVNFFAISKLLY